MSNVIWLLLLMFLLVLLNFLIVAVADMAAPNVAELLIVEVVVGVVSWAVSDILHHWFLPEAVASAPFMLQSGMFHAFHVELPISCSENVGVYERVRQALPHRLTVPAPTVAITH